MSQQDKQTGDHKTKQETSAGMGLEKFAMSSVRSMETQESSEVSMRLGKLLSWILLVAIVVGGVVWWLREGRNILWQPTMDDTQFLLSLNELEAAKQGLISDFEFNGRITLKFEINRAFPIRKQESQTQLRKVVRELVQIFATYRPNEDVRVKGYQHDEMVADGRLRSAGKQTAEGDSIWVHLEGEEMGPETLGHSH